MGNRGRVRFVVSSVVAGLIVGALASDAALAQSGRQRAGRGWARGGARVAAGALTPAGMALGRLNLSDQQRQQVKDVLAAHKPGLTALAERAAPARRALAAAIAAGEETAIRQASAVLAAVQADRAVLRGKVRSEILAILTPEQREKAKELRARVEKRVAARRVAARRVLRTRR